MTTSVIGSALLNVGAITFGSWIMHKLDPNGYEKEQERYHRALEKLQADKEAFVERETKRRNHLQALEKAKLNANTDFAKTNKLFAQHAEEQESDQEPVLSDYYHPSSKAVDYNNIIFGILGVATGGGLVALATSFL